MFKLIIIWNHLTQTWLEFSLDLVLYQICDFWSIVHSRWLTPQDKFNIYNLIKEMFEMIIIWNHLTTNLAGMLTGSSSVPNMWFLFDCKSLMSVTACHSFNITQEDHMEKAKKNIRYWKSIELGWCINSYWVLFYKEHRHFIFHQIFFLDWLCWERSVVHPIGFPISYKLQYIAMVYCENKDIFPVLLLSEQSNCIDWIIVYYM